MKALKLILISCIVFFTTNKVNAQNDTLNVKTSAICDQCKERIEHDLSFEKGVKSSSLNLDTKILTVIYNPAKTGPQKIREAITKIGYDADTVKAELKSYNKLPDCCKHESQHH